MLDTPVRRLNMTGYAVGNLEEFAADRLYNFDPAAVGT